MFSDHGETSPSIAAVSAPSVACFMLAVQQQKRSIKSLSIHPHDTVRDISQYGIVITYYLEWPKYKTAKTLLYMVYRTMK